MREYIHRKQGEEAHVPPLLYTVVEESYIVCNCKKVIYVVGDSLIGSACVGAGMLRYIHVPGYVKAWHSRNDEAGNFVTDIETVKDDETRKDIQRMLSDKYPSMQICFW